MPTLVSSACLWFSAKHRRWLTPNEALTLQGFPVQITHSYGQACCSFAAREMFQASGGPCFVSRGDASVDAKKKLFLECRPSRQAMFRMAGNSMHLNVSGVVLLYCLTEILVESDLLRIIYSEDKMERNPRRVRSSISSASTFGS